ncbi:GFA family protein [Rhizobium sp. BK251]|uniref:GFA family protein n=1 Tax=Rhizobium sp. BK251 TaxID=2512125 RepID=UPI001051A8ED|nr:GFA family protein [Rhizobium sp. BK251]TCL70209.1 hypothetical protein EV286_10778 [Rhizobium sp. BK251]
MTALLTHSGGCQCGAVRYRAKGELAYPHICYCRMCQKASGNYFMPFAGVARQDFEITRGEPSWFQSSDMVRRGFCSACGTPLFYNIPEADFINVTLGSLDNPSVLLPVAQSNLDSKMPWFHLLDGLDHEPAASTVERARTIQQSNHQHPDRDTETWPEEKS